MGNLQRPRQHRRLRTHRDAPNRKQSRRRSDRDRRKEDRSRRPRWCGCESGWPCCCQRSEPYPVGQGRLAGRSCCWYPLVSFSASLELILGGELILFVLLFTFSSNFKPRLSPSLVRLRTYPRSDRRLGYLKTIRCFPSTSRHRRQCQVCHPYALTQRPFHKELISFVFSVYIELYFVLYNGQCSGIYRENRLKYSIVQTIALVFGSGV